MNLTLHLRPPQRPLLELVRDEIIDLNRFVRVVRNIETTEGIADVLIAEPAFSGDDWLDAIVVFAADPTRGQHVNVQAADAATLFAELA